MDKARMINEAVMALVDSEDDDTIHPDMLARMLRTVVESSWQDGMSLEGLIHAARRKFQYGMGEGH